MNIVSNLSILDNKISEAVVYIRSDFFDHFFFFITWFGQWAVILFIVILLSVFFYFFNKKNFILPLFVIVAGSGIMTTLVKFLVHRVRPGSDIALYTESWPSFPSAHATFSFALSGFLIYCLWNFNIKVFLKIIGSTILLLLITAVGFSRLYLGVHFLTDIVGGYLVGLLWILITIYFLRRTSKPRL